MSLYPVDAGSKTQDGASNEAGRDVDRNPERKTNTYVSIALESIRDENQVADDIAHQLDESILYVRPRVTEMTQFGIVQYGPARKSPTTGKSVGTVRPHPDLIGAIMSEADREGIERAARRFILGRIEQTRSALKSGKLPVLAT